MRHAPSAFAAVVLMGVALAAFPVRGQVCGTLADAFVAEEVGLRREWVVQVPFDSAAWRLEQVTVADGIVIATAGDGSIHGIATGPAEPGRPMPGTVLWSRHFSRTEGNLQAPAAGSGIVLIAGDLHAFALDAVTGRTFWEEPLPNPPTAAAVISGDWAYLPLEGSRLLRLAVNPFRAPKESPVTPRKGRDSDTKKAKVDEGPRRPLSAEERIKPLSISTRGRVDTPPLPFQGGVLWCTTDGLLTALVPAKDQWQRSTFDLGGPPAGGPLVDGKTIFMATNPGRSASDIIRIDLLPIGLVYRWRAPLGDSVAGAIRLAGDTLLVPLATGGMAGLASDDGKRLWMHEPQVKLLTITSQRLWCIDAMGRLTTLDPATGGRLQQFCLGPFKIPVVNSTSDRLVLASAGGVVASLAPRAVAAAAATPEPAEAPAKDDAAPPDEDSSR